MATNSPDYGRWRRRHETLLAGLSAMCRHGLRGALAPGFQGRRPSSCVSLEAQKETPAQGGRGWSVRTFMLARVLLFFCSAVPRFVQPAGRS